MAPARADVDVLIPTRGRPMPLGITLAALLGQTHRSFRVVISDQSDGVPSYERSEVETICRVLELSGRAVERHHHLPRRGMAEQRQFLLDRATAPYVLCLDDDVILEPDAMERMLHAIREHACGFIGSVPLGPHYVGDERREQEAPFAPWQERVQPEELVPDGPGWERASLHVAANMHHIAERLGIRPEDGIVYRVAWVGGCCLYDRARLEAAGGFEFWHELPQVHVGEDVLAQLRVMERDGGAAIVPSGAWHQDRIPTTHPDRQHDAPWLLRAKAPSAAS